MNFVTEGIAFTKIHCVRICLVISGIMIITISKMLGPSRDTVLITSRDTVLITSRDTVFVDVLDTFNLGLR